MQLLLRDVAFGQHVDARVVGRNNFPSLENPLHNYLHLPYTALSGQKIVPLRIYPRAAAVHEPDLPAISGVNLYIGCFQK